MTPSDAVFSLGVGTDIEPSTDGELALDDVYSAVCPYVKAFPDREAYERWTEDVDAATVAMPLEGATHVAGALVD